MPSTAVILTTYNNPEALRKTLLGFLVQQGTSSFEVVIADDGSDQSTSQVLEDPALAPLACTHVWHPDDGFRACTIRNRAIAATAAEYLIFCDGDCIPRDDFVASHLRHARQGTFISASRVHIPEAVHQQFSDEDILSGRVFDVWFLASIDPALRSQSWRLRCRAWTERWMNTLTWRYGIFHGSNASAWRQDVQRVNGFDEEFDGYGSEDRDLGLRLRNSGTRSRYLKYSLVQLHLMHPRPYADPAIIDRNRRRLKQRYWDGVTRARRGLDAVATAACVEAL